MSTNTDTDSIQFQFPQRREVLARFAEQMDKWGLKVPAVEPLIMDFGFGDFEHTGLIECWIVNEIEAGYCGKYLFLFDGQRCSAHSHEKKHETFFVVKGGVRMVLDGKERIMNEGDVLAVPPGLLHTFVGVGNALILEISTPCLVEDNQFQDPKAAAWLKSNISRTGG